MLILTVVYFLPAAGMMYKAYESLNKQGIALD